jgi:hypothetical protein
LENTVRTTVATRHISAAVHLVLAGHPVTHVEPDTSARGKLIFHFGEAATPTFREYQEALRSLKSKAHAQLLALGWTRS